MRTHSPTARRAASEHGQILLVTAAGMIVLIGIAAIVIDLGFSWMLRRQEQNAADPGAVAAARYIPASGILLPFTPERLLADQAACFYARENGFFPSAVDNDGCVPANDPGGATLTLRSPPGSGAGGFEGRPGFVQVVISRQHDTFFGRIFGQTTATVTTGAVGANTDGNSNSSSLVALDPTCDNGPGGKISGNNAKVHIYKAAGVTGDGGYVHVNSSCGTHPTGSPSDCGNGTTDLKIDGATLITPHAYVHGVCTTSGAGAKVCDPTEWAGGTGICVDPEPVTEGAGRIGDPLAALKPPSFASLEAAYGPAFCPDGTESKPTDSSGCQLKKQTCGDDLICDLEPGIYYGGWKISGNISLKLGPGIYVIAGGGIDLLSGGTIDVVSGDPSVDARIMIYSTDNPTQCPPTTAMCQGPLKFSAAADFNAKAIDANTCAAQPITCPYKGILIWQDGDVESPGAEVRLGGQNTSVVSGTIYAPASNVILDGGSAGTGCNPGPNMSCLSVQIIAWRFDVVGGGTLDMPYDPAGLYQLDQKGLVH